MKTRRLVQGLLHTAVDALELLWEFQIRLMARADYNARVFNLLAPGVLPADELGEK